MINNALAARTMGCSALLIAVLWPSCFDGGVQSSAQPAIRRLAALGQNVAVFFTLASASAVSYSSDQGSTWATLALPPRLSFGALASLPTGVLGGGASGNLARLEDSGRVIPINSRMAVSATLTDIILAENRWAYLAGYSYSPCWQVYGQGEICLQRWDLVTSEWTTKVMKGEFTAPALTFAGSRVVAVASERRKDAQGKQRFVGVYAITADQGKSWRNHDYLAPGAKATQFTAVSAINETTFLVAGAYGVATYNADRPALFKTTDLGASWTVTNLSTPSANKPYRISSIGNLVMIGLNKHVGISRDAGLTWSYVQIGGDSGVSDVALMDGLRGFVGTFAGLFETADGGQTWHLAELPPPLSQATKNISDSTQLR